MKRAVWLGVGVGVGFLVLKSLSNLAVTADRLKVNLLNLSSLRIRRGAFSGDTHWEVTNSGPTSLRLRFIHLDISLGPFVLARVREENLTTVVPPDESRIIRVTTQASILGAIINAVLALFNQPRKALISGHLGVNNLRVRILEEYPIVKEDEG